MIGLGKGSAFTLLLVVSSLACADQSSRSTHFVDECKQRPNHAEMVACVRDYAASGYVRAQEELGLWLITGRYVEADGYEGAKWLYRAAVHESPVAMRRLGMFYIGHKSLVPGYAWLIVAGRFGDADAIAILRRYDDKIDAETREKGAKFANLLETRLIDPY